VRNLTNLIRVLNTNDYHPHFIHMLRRPIPQEYSWRRKNLSILWGYIFMHTMRECHIHASEGSTLTSTGMNSDNIRSSWDAGPEYNRDQTIETLHWNCNQYFWKNLFLQIKIVWKWQIICRIFFLSIMTHKVLYTFLEFRREKICNMNFKWKTWLVLGEEHIFRKKKLLEIYT
jgi:hypothetical protein